MKIIGYEMKLKTAISIVETSYTALVIIAFVGILASFLSLKGEKLVTVIILLLILLIVALFLKIKLINLISREVNILLSSFRFWNNLV